MNLMEMICVLLAVIFFTSVALIYNNSSFRQKQNLYDANSFVQASILAHEVLDEVDAKLFAKRISFDQIIGNYNATRQRHLPHVGETYQLTISAVQTDSTGVPLSTPFEGNVFTRVSVLVSPSAGMRHPLTMSRLYTKTHLSL
ncbi:MAG: hypothetical protein Q8M98_04340 [Candidatus Cloacimonadaceae bacterium]|nr:hypothetical protein [Candidatus Cloacimonadaceae bacterium]MDP3113988.1 hypothetical protein [Candidatus Cloacimonadaceae bacterium]